MKYLITALLILTGCAYCMENAKSSAPDQDAWESALKASFTKSMYYGDNGSAKPAAAAYRNQAPTSLSAIDQGRLNAKLPDLRSALSLQKSPAAVPARR